MGNGYLCKAQLHSVNTSFLLHNAPLLATLIVGTALHAQTTVSGTVSDNKKQSVPGANIILEGTYDGTTSDAEGLYSFTTEEQGKQLLMVSFIGYETYSDTIILNGGSMQIDIVLKEQFNELNAVVISAGAFEASDEKKNAMLKPLDIVTTAGANGDIYGALETLPGASRVGNEDGLFVRGGSDYETKTIIDGMVVNNPFYSTTPDIPSRGRFQPFLFKGTVFSTGGYSAEYGQALSSAIILNTEDMPDYSASGISLAPIFIGGFHTQKCKNEKTAFGGGLNYTNLAFFDGVYTPTTFDWIKSVESGDGNIFFRQKTSKTGIFKLYAQLEGSSLSLRAPDIDSAGLTDDVALGNRYQYVNATWREVLTDAWGVLAGVSYSKNTDIVIADGLDVGRGDDALIGKLTFNNTLSEKISIRYGTDYQQLNYRQNAGNLEFSAKDQYSAVFTEGDIFITNDLAGRIGVRAEHSSILDATNIAPRVSLAYKTGKNAQINLAYGDFYQTPQPMYLYSIGQYPLTYEKATHLIGNYQFVTDDRIFRIEGYYKFYDNLITLTADSINPFVPVTGNNGTGYARGIDVFFRDRKSVKYGDYWISYSYLDTRRRFLDYPEEVMPTFAAQHILSLVGKYYFSSINTQVSATYRYISGWPYFNPNNPQFLGDISPALHNVSLSASYLASLWGNFTVIFLSWDNAPGFEQIYGYRYSADGSNMLVNQAPVKSSVFLGVFMSILQGQDRRLNDLEIDKSNE